MYNLKWYKIVYSRFNMLSEDINQNYFPSHFKLYLYKQTKFD